MSSDYTSGVVKPTLGSDINTLPKEILGLYVQDSRCPGNPFSFYRISKRAKFELIDGDVKCVRKGDNLYSDGICLSSIGEFRAPEPGMFLNFWGSFLNSFSARIGGPKDAFNKHTDKLHQKRVKRAEARYLDKLRNCKICPFGPDGIYSGGSYIKPDLPPETPAASTTVLPLQETESAATEYKTILHGPTLNANTGAVIKLWERFKE